MAQRPSVESQRAGLANRLRPLYVGLQTDEFERMVARIAEIELYGSGVQPTDLGGFHVTRSGSRASVSTGAVPQVVRHG